MKFKLVLALFIILLGTPVYAQIDQSLCMQCLATAKEELKKCLDEAISQEDKKSCQEKQATQTTTCENGECKIERAAQSGNKSEALPTKKYKSAPSVEPTLYTLATWRFRYELDDRTAHATRHLLVSA